MNNYTQTSILLEKNLDREERSPFAQSSSPHPNRKIPEQYYTVDKDVSITMTVVQCKLFLV